MKRTTYRPKKEYGESIDYFTMSRLLDKQKNKHNLNVKCFQQQILLPNFGKKGQRKLHSSSVLVLGIGAVGSIAAVYLARAGLGRLGIVDPDIVEEHNLHRQVFFDRNDIGQLKVDVLHSKLIQGNTDIVVEVYPRKADVPFLTSTIYKYDIVLDAVDNFTDKLIVNDVACCADIPLVFVGADEYIGQALTIVPGQGPCLRCIIQKAPLAHNGLSSVFGPVAAIVGSIQASEAIKILLGIGTPLIGRFLLINTLDWSITVLPIKRRNGCKTCAGIVNK